MKLFAVGSAPMVPVAPLNILSASIVLDTSLDGWCLLEPSWDGDPATDGGRAFRYTVSFSCPFSAPPVVQVALVGLDVSKDDNTRLRLKAEDITAYGFTLVAETWFNTRMWSVGVSWLAIGT